MTTLEDRKARLLERLKELDTRLHDIEAEFDTHKSTDWEDQAIENEPNEVLEDLSEASLREARMISAALARIRSGTYGICTKCGNEISAERLDALPHTPFCRNCA